MNRKRCLMKLDKKFWSAVFTLCGTIIGAGILGLPYVFAQAGFFIGLFWIIFLGVIVLYVFLCLGEVALRTKETHQLLGYTELYLGRGFKGVMFFALLFGVYTALLAYLIGEGEILSFIFSGSSYAFYYALGFWFFMTVLLREGLRGLRRIETYGVLAILTLILIIFTYYLPQVSLNNLMPLNTTHFFLPFGIVLFALIGFNCVPELEMILKGSEKKLRSAITWGVLIPITVYILFTLAVVGFLGGDIPQISTIGLGKLVSTLGVFTMLTSYFVLSFSLKDVYHFDLGYQKRVSFFLVSVIPLLLYITLYYTHQLNFIRVIGIGGVISGGLTGILILFMNIHAKKLGRRKPEYSMPINWFIITLISLVFIAGMIVEIVL